METHDIPWIKVIPGDICDKPIGSDTRLTSTSVYHAFFACEIQIRSRDVRDMLKWGWNWGALLDEAIDRQRLFIESQHFVAEPGQTAPLECRTLALRYLYDPQSPGLQMGIVGKVIGITEETARIAAVQHWRQIQSTFPHDYVLIPATSEQDYHRLMGQNLIEDARVPDAYAEVQRFENVVSTGEQRFYLLGSWHFSVRANEQIWRVLAGSEQRVLLDILLRPTVLTEAELVTLQLISQHIGKIAEDVDLITVQPYARFAAEHYKKLLQFLRHPYIVQMRLVAPDGLPAYIPRTIGFALTHNEDRELAMPGFQAIHPQTQEDVEKWRYQLSILEPDIQSANLKDKRFARIRKMSDAYEANVLFRLPYPSQGGLPGGKLPIMIDEDGLDIDRQQ
ncbi:MAG: hypothetical protein AB1649_29540 [Chloroflexota bacterium]